MAEVVIMPKLGFNMDEGQLVKWCKSVGDAVAKGDVLFEINTDKTTMPVEATMDGVLLKTMLEEGAFADVFTPIAVIGRQGEDADAALAAHAGGGSAPAAPVAASAAPAAAAPPVAAAAAVNVGDLKLTPKAKKLIKDEGLDPASLGSVQGTGFRGGITAKDIKASPLARKVAARDGVDLASVQGSGVGGKIMKADVAGAPLSAAGASAAAGTEEKKIRSVTPYKGVRKVIGQRLAQSMSDAPHVYFTASVDTSKLTAFRAELNASGEGKVAVSDLLVLAASRTLQQYPEVNVSLVGDEVVCYRSTNVGIAVAGDNGLIVPVVKNVQEKSLSAVAVETRDLVERAKAGRLDPSEYSGGTFTISNLGPFGIENFTAIVNPPESAILAVSAVKKIPVVETDAAGNDTVVIRPMMNIQLSVDHRVIDGLLAANFVKYFKELLETPIRILM
ncbi:Pyruvate dehydrogenase complex dihydrolipoamide acetyltransferase [uncultured delta proteobacterium]|uniref:Dihydrolipoamide acetyltransferase component of pyruvate dehydrogenase complex n=1 Tax=uncultured delta proteobacterium TaxID=34034 RepID=A0A212J903_9DELT|nr:Pyruvate dehydrogenase complex dihydrolipoamide acetyltransferase [uncultured delta proteobacterium]